MVYSWRYNLHGVFESLDVELSANIRWHYQVLTYSNITKLSHFSSSLCHPFWILASCKIFPLNSPHKSCPGGEIFRIWTRGNNIFFPVKRENNGKTIFIWTGSKTFCFIIRETMFRITSFYSCAFQPVYVFNRIPQALFRLMTVFWSHWNIRKLMVFWYFQGA